jgi:hypothetical protein
VLGQKRKQNQKDYRPKILSEAPVAPSLPVDTLAIVPSGQGLAMVNEVATTSGNVSVDESLNKKRRSADPAGAASHPRPTQ